MVTNQIKMKSEISRVQLGFETFYNFDLGKEREITFFVPTLEHVLQSTENKEVIHLTEEKLQLKVVQ